MITLTNGSAHAVVNPDGAWVGELGTNGDTILFPLSVLTNKAGEQKARGGMHVCLPNFGPGGESGLAQHGFGRISTWTVLQQDESTVVLRLESRETGYAGLEATLTYELEDDSFAARLELTNRSSEPMRVAPGFHPYFALGSSEKKVWVNNERYELDNLEGTEYEVTTKAELRTQKHVLTLLQENLTTWAIWTDQLGPYVCVEPTFGGNRFLEAARSDEALAPGQTRTYSVRIHW